MVAILECEGRFPESLVLSVLNLVLKYGGSQVKIATPLAATSAIALFNCTHLDWPSDSPLPDCVYVRL